MIVRTWRTRFDPNQKDRLVAYANDVSLPVLSTHEGVCGVLFFLKDDEWVTMTLWETPEAIGRLDDDPEYRRIVDGILELGVLGTEQSVEIFEYEGGTPIRPPSKTS